jgi:hypothetical protein
MVGLSKNEVLQRVDMAIDYIKSDPRINNRRRPLDAGNAPPEGTAEKLAELVSLIFCRLVAASRLHCLCGFMKMKCS